MGAAPKIDIPNPVTRLNQTLDRVVCDAAAVAEMEEMQVLSKACDRIDRGIRDPAALGENEIPETWRNVNNPLDCAVGEFVARCQVKNAEMLVGSVWWERQEGGILNELATGKPEFAERLSLGQQSCDRFVADEAALVEIDLENVGTVLGKRDNSLVI